MHLGEQLRSGQLPEWNPSAFGGAPFAADPLSGWTYVPAMLLFALLPPDSAIAAFIFCHMLLAGASLYALGRVLGLRTPAALIAAGAYAYSGFFQFHSVAAQPYVALAAWVPLALFGVELGLRSPHGGSRLWAWTLSGVALSQTLAVWPGQGSYYAVLLFVGWTVARARLRATATHVAVPVLIALALDAAALLPRLEFQSLSNLAEGYPVTALVGGWRVPDFARLAVPGAWDVGLCALGLSVVGVLPCAARAIHRCCSHMGDRGRTGQLDRDTAAHLAVPRAARLRTASSACLRACPHSHVFRARAAGRDSAFKSLPRACNSSCPCWCSPNCSSAGRMGVDQQIGARWDGLARVPSYESRSLQQLQLGFSRHKRGRSAIWAMHRSRAGQIVPYTQRFADPATQALLVNNRALALGLEDVQGYNAVHLARFDAYLRELNAGQTQNYHDGQVFAPGLDSPLLDLMGVRYTLVAADDQSATNVVYSDSHVRVLERPSVLPRSWLVHDAQVASAADALQLIDSGAVDPRETVLLEQASVDFAARYVVFGEMGYPGWTAYVDGQPMRPILADGVVQAVPLPPGDHTVELRFESFTLRAGLAVSMASFLVLLVCNAAARTGRRAARIARAPNNADP